MKKDIYAANMKILRKHHPLFATLIELNEPSDYQYVNETAKNGSCTLSISYSGKNIQIHSRYDPEKEAAQQISGMNFRNPKLLIIFGIGLGYHIRAALNELKETNLYIIVIEKDSQALINAVRNVDLKDLFLSPKIRWGVGIPEEEGYPVFLDLIGKAGIVFQLFLKTLVVFDHPALTKIHGEYNKNMLRKFREAAEKTIYNYGNCPKDSMIGVENIMKNLGLIMKNPGVKDLFGAFKGLPGIIVSTGPSLDKNIEELKNAFGKAVIISADSAFQVLYNHGIKPHGVSSLERTPNLGDLFTSLPDESMKDVYYFATPVINPYTYASWKGKHVVTYRSFAHFNWIQIEKGTLKTGQTCSNMTFKILEAFGCDPIILVGQDCSFKSIDQTHALGSSSLAKPNLKKEDLFPIKGNIEDFVMTNSNFNMTRKDFVNDVAKFRGICINSTEGGAFIEGTVIMPLREAIEKYCTKSFDVLKIFNKKLIVPNEAEIKNLWKNFHSIIRETEKDVREVIEFCEKGEKKVNDFELELANGGYTEIDDFLARFPKERLDNVYYDLTKSRGDIIMYGRHFNLYLMHIIQMIIVHFEMELNQLLSISDDDKRCKLQAIRIMKQWFPRVGDVCKVSYKLLEDAKKDLENEFGSQE
ncbi:MAG: motility associated factor glycosyltransferase family protein [Candidatus Riflebacteria bacterium]|nr:motility associated factor glycosyltransferase family protein [Candidatus Riflebacteria bacterium]